MELKDIVAISGKSGLHKVIGRIKNGLIVESIANGAKFVTNYQDKVSVLEDISIYTTEGDLKLSEVFIKLKNAGNTPESKEDLKVLRKYLIDTISLDSERVYDSDIKKLITWFNMVKDILNFDKLIIADNINNSENSSDESKNINTEEKQAKD